jgi:hypothetical protein
MGVWLLFLIDFVNTLWFANVLDTANTTIQCTCTLYRVGHRIRAREKSRLLIKKIVEIFHTYLAIGKVHFIIF